MDIAPLGQLPNNTGHQPPSQGTSHPDPRIGHKQVQAHQGDPYTQKGNQAEQHQKQASKTWQMKKPLHHFLVLETGGDGDCQGNQERDAEDYDQVVAQFVMNLFTLRKPPDLVEGILHVVERGHDRQQKGYQADHSQRTNVGVADIMKNTGDHLVRTGGNIGKDNRSKDIMYV